MSENTYSGRYGETMITPLDTGGAFWTTGTRNRRRTALGATAIVVFLALISYLVWMSPSDSAVRTIVGDVVKPISTTEQLRHERANLMSELVSTKSTVSNQSAELSAQRAQLEAALGKAKALEKQLSAAKAGESKAEGAVASYKAQLAALGHGSSGASAASGATGFTSTVAGSGDTTVTTPPSGPTTTAPTGPVQVTTPSLASIKNPTSRYFGLYTAQSPFSFSEFNQDSVDIGAQPNVAGYFQGWDQDFRADAVQASWAKGDLPFMTWESQSSTASNNAVNQPAYSLTNIIKGDFDAYLTKYADGIVANKQPLAIRLDQEMNATWYPWSEDDGHGNAINGNLDSPNEYAQMWRHVWNIFQSQGANDYVAWVWSPNRIDQLTAAHKSLDYLTSLYPGDQYVDFVGMSGYERPATTGNKQDTTYADTFANTIAQLKQVAPSKKIMLSEVGAAEVGPSGGSIKPAWITSFFDGIAADPQIVGFSWFSETVTTSSNGQTITNDWRINSTAASVKAFAAGIQRTDTGFSLRPVQQ